MEITFSFVRVMTLILMRPYSVCFSKNNVIEFVYFPRGVPLKSKIVWC